MPRVVCRVSRVAGELDHHSCVVCRVLLVSLIITRVSYVACRALEVGLIITDKSDALASNWFMLRCMFCAFMSMCL